MKISQRIRLALGIGLLLPSFGCASIVSGRNAKVSIASNVPNAHVSIRDKRGDQVATTNTPSVANTSAVVELKRNDKYFMPARYTATVEAPGYQPAQFEIHSTVNPWILGNVVFGGVIGLVVDNASGAAWKPTEDKFAANLAPVGYANQSAPAAVAQTSAKPAAAAPWASSAYPGVQTAMNAPATSQPAAPNNSLFGPPATPGNESITPLPAGQATLPVGQTTAYQAQSNWPPASPTR